MDELIDKEEFGGDKVEDVQDAIAEKFATVVSDFAKPCIVKAIDYTMLGALLVLQFFRCQPMSTEDIMSNVKENNLDAVNATSVYSCDLNGTSIIFASNTVVNVFSMIAVVIGLLYGVVVAVIVFIHSRRQGENTKVHPLTEKLYKFTDKILIIDTALEIPISFYWAPLMTIILWGFFAVAVVAIFLIASLYNTQVKDDENAKAVFASSAFLVVLSLFKLTGEVSQYWVKYVTSTLEDAEDQFDQYESSKERGGSILQNMFSFNEGDTK
eukprot:CAMPEP_0203707700 /NCGR_PEP_ID=MMETSP0091-20130426/56584_1 /ASSEMBLY_ACC=CAM_ASM_001089 /TAXON_ID=426623 /ORGANISM="Chaetoceros affinis, Strain CCMP159" /LENGTH=268 /DNA_ID=CAMNT_0050583985 /DNA_START=14 /DNA_END=820 /DNA_ORIENTATION=-